MIYKNHEYEMKVNHIIKICVPTLYQ